MLDDPTARRRLSVDDALKVKREGTGMSSQFHIAAE
jgi:hypothetical protein